MNFEIEFNKLQKEAHQTAIEKGWYDTDRDNPELIALIHSELSEALEAARHGNPSDNKIPEFSGIEAELADAIIRIMDMAEANKLNVAGALIAKMAYNKTRSYRHGNKKY